MTTSKYALKPFGLFLLYCLFAASLWAQSGSVVTGRVFNQTDALIPGVSVELLSTNDRTTRTTITDGDGVYRFEGAPAGGAEVTFRLINFSTVRRAISVAAGIATTTDARLVDAGILSRGAALERSHG